MGIRYNQTKSGCIFRLSRSTRLKAYLSAKQNSSSKPTKARSTKGLPASLEIILMFGCLFAGHNQPRIFGNITSFIQSEGLINGLSDSLGSLQFDLFERAIHL